MNIHKLAQILQDRDQTLDWLIEKRLLPGKMHCQYCHNVMNCQRHSGWGRFRCRNIILHKKAKAKKVNVVVSVSKGTWFELCKLKVEEILVLMYGFSQNWSYERVRKESTFGEIKLSVVSIRDWFHHCRTVCVCTLERRYQSEKPVGGPDRIVHIVEIKLDNYVCDKSSFEHDSLILAVIDDISGYRLVMCANGKCDATTIISVIKKHVVPGSEIRTDKSKPYNNYIHIKGYYHNPIAYDKKKRENNHWKHVCDFLWRREVTERNLDPFEALIEAIIFVFPIYESTSPKLENDDDDEG